MSSSISDPYQNKSDNRSITVIKTSGDLDETEKALVTTNGMVVKEGNNDTGTKPNVVKEAITFTVSKIRFTQSTKQRNHKNPIKR